LSTYAGSCGRYNRSYPTGVHLTSRPVLPVIAASFSLLLFSLSQHHRCRQLSDQPLLLQVDAPLRPCHRLRSPQLEQLSRRIPMPDIEISRRATSMQAAPEDQGPSGDGLLDSVRHRSIITVRRADKAGILLAIPVVYVAGAAFPPTLVLLLYPRYSPPPPDKDSTRGKAITCEVEQDAQGLSIVEKMRGAEGWYETSEPTLSPILQG